MASTTVTATLAQAGAQPKANHAAPNVVSDSVVLAVSTSGSGAALLCKVPANAIITRFAEFHSAAGATTYTLNFGYRAGRTSSYTVSAILADGAISTENVAPYTKLPLTLSRDETLGEQFKYVTASLVSASDTGSVTINYTLEYILPGQEA